jgi:hypothetical protein
MTQHTRSLRAVIDATVSFRDRLSSVHERTAALERTGETLYALLQELWTEEGHLDDCDCLRCVRVRRAAADWDRLVVRGELVGAAQKGATE